MTSTELTCGRCGHTQPDGEYCEKCGRAVAASHGACAKCGSPQGVSGFCPQCGTGFQDGSSLEGLSGPMSPRRFRRRRLIATSTSALVVFLIAFGVSFAIFSSSSAPDTPSAAQALFPVRVNGRMGYINQAGRLVIQPRFDEAFVFSEGLAPIVVDDMLGYIDAKGKVVIEPKYDYSVDTPGLSMGTDQCWFHDGYAAVALGGKWGLIDSKGNLVVSPRFHSAYGVAEGTVVVQTGPEWNTWGYADLKGQILFSAQFSLAGAYKDGRAFVRLDDSDACAWIGKNGQILLGPYDDGSDFAEEGLAYVQKGQTCGFIDQTGRMLFTTQRFDLVYGFHEGMCQVMITGSDGQWKWGFIDETGNFAIPALSDWAFGPFNDGLAAAHEPSNGKWGYIDRTGQWAIPAQYEEAHDFDHGLAQIATKSGKIGYIGTAGQIVWPLQD
jgi:hypothetical protein